MKVQHQKGPAYDAMKKAIRELEATQARAGFFDTSVYPDGTPVAYVAAAQEYGTPTAPARSFFRPTMKAKKNAWADLMRNGAKAVISGRLTAEQMLEQFGQSVAGSVKETISQIQNPALAESTIKARQSKRKSPGVSTKPLVDSGYMISQVSNDVVTK